MGLASPKIAWADESVRTIGNPPFYLLAATVMDAGDIAALESLMRLKPTGAAKLHWRDMAFRAQRKSLSAISDLDATTLVAMAKPLDGKRQERARRKCLEALLIRLERENVTSLVLESRGHTLDLRDLDFVKQEKASRRIEGITVHHADARMHPELWVPDQLLGALGDSLTRVGNWQKWAEEWKLAKRDVEVIDVSLLG